MAGYQSTVMDTSSATTTSATGSSVSSVIAKDGQNAELKELRSDDGRFRFVVKDSGSLVLYKEFDAIWALYTDFPPSPCARDRSRLIVQTDGNLVVVHETRGVVWTSGTGNCGPGPFRLTMHNDGNCVLYDGLGNERWSSKTPGWG